MEKMDVFDNMPAIYDGSLAYHLHNIWAIDVMNKPFGSIELRAGDLNRLVDVLIDYE